MGGAPTGRYACSEKKTTHFSERPYVAAGASQCILAAQLFISNDLFDFPHDPDRREGNRGDEAEEKEKGGRPRCLIEVRAAEGEGDRGDRDDIAEVPGEADGEEEVIFDGFLVLHAGIMN